FGFRHGCLQRRGGRRHRPRRGQRQGHGGPDIFRVCGGRGGGRQRAGREQCNCCEGPHWACPFACGSCAGGGRIGGLSVEVSFFCTSISEIKMAGATAET